MEKPGLVGKGILLAMVWFALVWYARSSTQNAPLTTTVLDRNAPICDTKHEVESIIANGEHLEFIESMFHSGKCIRDVGGDEYPVTIVEGMSSIVRIRIMKTGAPIVGWTHASYIKQRK